MRASGIAGSIFALIIGVTLSASAAEQKAAAPTAAQKVAMYERILDDLVARKLLAAGTCSRPSMPICCKVGGYAACERSVAECNRLGGTPVASAPGCY